MPRKFCLILIALERIEGMRKVALTVLALWIMCSALANGYVPKLHMVGETVAVKILKDVAEVSCIFEYDDPSAKGADLVYFPIFSDGTETALECLAASAVSVQIGGEEVKEILPCDRPADISASAYQGRVYWYTAKLPPDDNSSMDLPVKIVLSYKQRLISSQFLYWPIIFREERIGHSSKYSYQMFVRKLLSAPLVVDRELDSVVLGDVVCVYLKNHCLVRIK